MKDGSMHRTFISLNDIPILSIPTLITFHQQLPNWPLFFLVLSPKPFSLCFQEPSVVFLKYRSEHFPPLLEAFEWVPIAFRMKPKYSLAWLRRPFLFHALATSSSSPAPRPHASSAGNSSLNKLLLDWLLFVFQDSLTITPLRKPVGVILMRNEWVRVKSSLEEEKRPGLKAFRKETQQDLVLRLL